MGGGGGGGGRGTMVWSRYQPAEGADAQREEDINNYCTVQQTDGQPSLAPPPKSEKKHFKNKTGKEP